MTTAAIQIACDLDNISFLSALGGKIAKSERLICCSFRGDPGDVAARDWRPIPWNRSTRFTSSANNYVAISAFGRSPDESFRRTTATFAAGLALMVDDVGTKVDPKVVHNLRPTAIIETSPDNFQWWYFLADPCRDRAQFDHVIRQFILAQLCGADPGMAGVNRVGRLPNGMNGKPKHNGWQCRATEWKPDRRYSIKEICAFFKIPARPINASPLDRLRRQRARNEGEARAAAFKELMIWLEKANVFKAHTWNTGGWREIHCPWKAFHSDRTDTGAAIGLPNLENGFYGAFQCHHGHCQEKTYTDFVNWALDIIADQLNGGAGEWRVGGSHGGARRESTRGSGQSG